MTLQTEASVEKTATEMTAGRWVAVTLGLIVLLALVNILVAWRLDVFGVLRDPTGRALITSEHERKAKYLLNEAYVPANFNALIIGASASVNWHPELLAGYRFYNESVEGGDASEERKLVEQALPKGHFKVALVGLYPRITGLHVLQDGFDKVNRSEVVGSISSFGVESDLVMDRLRHRPSTFYPNGSHVLPQHHSPLPGEDFGKLDGTQDGQAIEDYRLLVRELMDRGTRIIYVASPLYGPYYEANRGVMEGYMASVRREMPAAPMIDFNAGEYAGFRNDAENFIDSVHLSALGAERLSVLLNERMQGILAGR